MAGQAPRTTDAAGAVYGAVVATALVVGLSLDRPLGPGEGAVALVASCAAFWAAHVYAEAVRARYAAGRWLRPREVAALGRHEAPQLAAALPSAVVLAAGAAGALGRDAAFLAAAWSGVGCLFALGVRFGAEAGLGLAGRLASGLVDALLGVGVIALKVVLSH